MTGSYGRVVWLARPSHVNAQLQASGHLQDSLASQTNGRVDYDTVIHYNLYLIITYAACTYTLGSHTCTFKTMVAPVQLTQKL